MLMHQGDLCREQAAECLRLSYLPQSAAEAASLSAMAWCWSALAIYTDRYVELVEATHPKH